MRRVVAGLIVLVAACGPDDQVRAEFMRAHPGAEVLSLGVGEGDGDNAYYHIHYRAPNDSAVHEACWLYSQVNGRDWQRVHRRDRGGC